MISPQKNNFNSKSVSHYKRCEKVSQSIQSDELIPTCKENSNSAKVSHYTRLFTRCFKILSNGFSSCPPVFDNIIFDSSFFMNEDYHQAAICICMPLIDEENRRSLKMANEKSNRDDYDDDLSLSSSMEIISTFDYDYDFIVHVLNSLIECPLFIGALCNGNIKAYCPFMDMMEPYRTANSISMKTPICNCKKGMNWKMMQNHLRQMQTKCMLYFAVYKFVEEYSQLINGKTNVKSQNFKANKIRNDSITV